MRQRKAVAAEELLQFLYLTPVGVVKFAADGAVDLMNPAATALLMPFAAGGDLGNLFVVMAALAPGLEQQVKAFRATSGSIVDQQWLEVPEGPETLILSLTVTRINRDVYMAVLSDVSRIAAQDRALFADREKFRAIFANVRDYAIYTIKVDGGIDEWNPSLERYAGWLADDVLGQSLAMFWREQGAEPRSVDDLLKEAQKTGSVNTEGWQLKRDGSRLWGDTVITALPDETAAIRGFVVVSRDMTERKRLDDALQRLATVDPLTGAFNRRHGDACLAAEFARRSRDNKSFALLMLDIDHFKAVNDRYGHASGGAVLNALTRVCRASLRSADTISRWGGEEFLLILPGADDSAAMVAAERVRAAVAATEVSTVDGTVLRFTVSIGVATPAGGDQADLIQRADAALYAAKADGRNRVKLSA